MSNLKEVLEVIHAILDRENLRDLVKINRLDKIIEIRFRKGINGRVPRQIAEELQALGFNARANGRYIVIVL